MKKTMRIILTVAFVLYCGVLVYLLFSGPGRRDRSYIPLGEYIKTYSNFIPFYTIIEFTSGLFRGTVSKWYFFRNVIGNLFLFFPMGVFLPCLFRPMRRFYRTVAVTGVAVIVIECLQLFLRVGSFDIDDLILNLAGCMLAYGICKIGAVRRLLVHAKLLTE